MTGAAAKERAIKRICCGRQQVDNGECGKTYREDWKRPEIELHHNLTLTFPASVYYHLQKWRRTLRCVPTRLCVRLTCSPIFSASLPDRPCVNTVASGQDYCRLSRLEQVIRAREANSLIDLSDETQAAPHGHTKPEIRYTHLREL